MIVINYGLPKSASTFVYQLTASILSAAGHDQTAIRRAHLPEELRADDLPLVPEVLHTLLDSVPARSILTVKTHYPLEPLRDLTRNQQVRAIVTVRDPRDAMLSFMDFVPELQITPARAALMRKYPRPDGKAPEWTGPGPRRIDFDVALRYYVERCPEAMTWWQASGILRATFVEIVDAPQAVARRLAAHLGLEPRSSRRWPDPGRVARRIAARLGFRRGRTVDTDAIVDWFLTDRTRIMHYSTGERSRFRRLMTPEQIGRCDAALALYIEAFTGTSPPGA